MCVNNIIVSCEDCCSWQTHKCSGLILYYLVDLQIWILLYDCSQLTSCHMILFFVKIIVSFAEVIVIWMVITMLEICPLLKCFSWQIRAIIICLTHYVWNLSHCWSSDRFVLCLKSVPLLKFWQICIKIIALPDYFDIYLLVCVTCMTPAYVWMFDMCHVAHVHRF